MSKRLLVFFALIFAGCSSAAIKEACRGIAGNSTKALVDTRPSASSRVFDCGLEECRVKAEAVLGEMKTYVYAREGELTAVFVSEQDTTPAGVFISRISPGKTRIEVSSPSTYAREIISRKLFAGMDRKLKAKKIEVQLDSIEEKRK